jgi:hypothetical protein
MKQERGAKPPTAKPRGSGSRPTPEAGQGRRLFAPQRPGKPEKTPHIDIKLKAIYSFKEAGGVNLKNRKDIYSVRKSLSVIIIAVMFMVFFGRYIQKKEIDASGLIVTLTAVIGVFALWFQSERNRDLAMGQFIATLNSDFNNSDNNTIQLYHKIVCEEKITSGDRALIAAYLTFFETLYLLVKSDILDISVIDDLFRDRFFSAVHNIEIQNIDLLPDAHTYFNICKLLDLWTTYLVKIKKIGKPDDITRRPVVDLGQRQLPQSFYKRGLNNVHFHIKRTDEQDDAASIHTLMQSVSDVLKIKNTGDYFALENLQYVREHIAKQSSIVLTATLRDDALCGILIAKLAEADDELWPFIENNNTDRVAIMDTIVVAEPNRGYGLQQLLILNAEKTLKSTDIDSLYATVHPQNKPSLDNFLFLDYKICKNIQVYGGKERLLLRKSIK